ncbi:5'(3')-deoxyribonucleotidase [Paenibacillus sp. UNC496MF]|nr:5'-3'-deoxyribonucleotidase [Paenibacillus sp. UNC496MF]SFJ64822.1 5'(3')-deoxyribonucleotidase [Paenibacillus sp. UNC496MF]
MKIIGVDLDSTLNNLDAVWLERYNKDYGDNLTKADMISWDVTHYVKPECGKKMYDYLREPGFFRNLGIQPHAAEVMSFLHEYFEVYIVSSSHPNVVADKWAWVEKHLPFIDYHHFVPLHHKHRFEMDYLIDDGPHNFDRFKGTGILIDMPYNQHLRSKYKRCTDWLDVKDYFQTLIRKEERW